MRRYRTNLRTRLRRNREQGVVILLVAVFMLFVIGAMAALSIDVVTLYTARSEAQLAADATALAAARVLANSGATSDTNGTLMPLAQPIASAVAIQVAQQNQVGGAYLTNANVTAVNFGGTNTNPTVTVSVQANLPTFFARIWGSTQVTVGATATAEAYNPSPASGAFINTGPPVAPMCVKPWLLPNKDPRNPSNSIFNPTTGNIEDTSLLGWPPVSTPMTPACLSSGCTPPPLPGPAAWNYYPGGQASFPAPPASSLPACAIAFTNSYPESIAGCIQTPISCNSFASIDTGSYNGNQYSDTTDAVNCLTHATTTGGGDTVVSTYPLTAPFQFVAGADNPIPGAAGNNVMVSDSLVTVPVFDNGTNPPSATGNQIVGFVQLFLNPLGSPNSTSGYVDATVINLAGCGTSASGNPILGNGASPVAVRLISP